MKIRVRDHVKVATDRMARIGLSGTTRTQLDLYCVAVGQSLSRCNARACASRSSRTWR